MPDLWLCSAVILSMTTALQVVERMMIEVDQALVVLMVLLTHATPECVVFLLCMPKLSRFMGYYSFVLFNYTIIMLFIQDHKRILWALYFLLLAWSARSLGFSSPVILSIHALAHPTRA